MTYDASDRKDVRRMEKASALAERNRIAFVRQIMSQPLGRAWMLDLLERCHIFGTAFVVGRPDMTAFALGEQNIGLPIFADVVAHCPQDYILMMQDKAVQEASDARLSTNLYADGAPTPAWPEQSPGRDDLGSVDDGDYPGGYVDDSGFVHYPKPVQ